MKTGQMWNDRTIENAINISYYKESEVAQLCTTLCDPMDCSPPGSSIHGIFQARILEWVAISVSISYYTQQ